MSDLIDRQQAIDALMDRFKNSLVGQKAATDAIKTVPSAERTGHWIDKNYGHWNTIRAYECSACGKTDERIHDSANYCPNCGARME